MTLKRKELHLQNRLNSMMTNIQFDRSDQSCYAFSMKTIAAYEAKSKFSEILREAAAGEVFVITRNGQRMAELRPCAPVVKQRKRGMMKKVFGPVPADFNEPLSDFDEYQ
jgi:prevent-host-death family protein